MRKSYWIIVLIISILTPAGYTQEEDTEMVQVKKTDYREDLMFGLKAGVNHSNVYEMKGEEFRANSKLGIASGFFAAIPFGRYIGIQPEILLSQKGFKATGRLFGGNYDLIRTTTYIDVPIYLSLKPAKFITLLAGPQYSYLLKQTDKFKNGTTSIAQELEFENAPVRKSSLCFAGGADIKVDHFVIGGRAGWDMLNNNGDGTSPTPRYKNSWLQLSIGFLMY